jgi:hypothetical protein
MFPLSCAGVPLPCAHWIVSAQLEFAFENAVVGWSFSDCATFHCTNQLINQIKRMLFFNFYCK